MNPVNEVKSADRTGLDPLSLEGAFARLDESDDRIFYEKDRCAPIPVPSPMALREGIME